MNIIGLTGGIATGKTTISNFLAKLNVTTIDADIINRHLLEPNHLGYLEILKIFPDIPLLNDKSLDKNYLRNKIFNDIKSKVKLENILHPLIKKEIQHQIKYLQDNLNTPYCVISVPLMIEANFNHLVSELWVSDCSEKTQLKRLMARDNISLSTAKVILSNQLSRQDRLQHADEIISTEDKSIMEEKIKYLHQQQILMNS